MELQSRHCHKVQNRHNVIKNNAMLWICIRVSYNHKKYKVKVVNLLKEYHGTTVLFVGAKLV